MTGSRWTRWVVGGGVALALGVLAGCGKAPAPPPGGPYTYDVDPSLVPSPSSLDEPGRGTRPLAASRDARGTVSVFVENEVVLSGVDAGQLSAFLARSGGTVVESNGVPDPPAGLGITLSPADKAPTSYVVRIDPSTVSLDSVAQDAAAAGFGGTRSFSSDAASRLMALMMHERRSGVDVSPNYVDFGDHALVHTNEFSTYDAFQWPGLRMGDTLATGSKSSVLRAWQLLTAHGLPKKVAVAILDGGFWLEGSGYPGSPLSSGVSDLPYTYWPYQYDFLSGDYTAGGTNPAQCTGGFPCPWHGNGSAGVATGMMDNDYGAVGTGALSAEPFLFKIDMTRYDTEWAVRTAQKWGASVVSMSFGGDCNLDCWSFMSQTYTTMFDAQKAGVVLVAAAGNDNKRVDDDPVWPCMVMPRSGTPGALCVGALADGTNKRISYSNYGPSVDIFAPTDIPAMPNPDSAGALVNHNGTSASTPFVAGVVAMMKAADPSLTASEVDSIIKDTAWTDSTDSRVPRYLNAYAAVRKVLHDTLPADAMEPNDTPTTPRVLPFGTTEGPLTLAGDPDFYTFTLSDYSSVSLGMEFMPGLSDVGFYLVGGAPPPGGKTVSPRDDGADVTYDLMAPGTYTATVLGDLNQYYLKLTAQTAALAPDAFEVNDTLATAAAMSSGSYEVTRHTAGDDDYYAFTVPALVSGFTTYAVSVPTADRKVTLDVYQGGALVSSWPAATHTSIQISDPGSYVVRVSGSQRTRYTFQLGVTVDLGSLPSLPISLDRVWWIDPTGPVSRWLVGPRDGLAISLSARGLTAYQQLTLAGAGLHLRLFDDQGALVAEGVPVNADITETLPLSGVVADQRYILVVERAQLPAVQDALLPLVSYQIGVQ